MEGHEKNVAGNAKDRWLFLGFALALGAVVGAVVWLCLKVMSLGIAFFWEILPSYWDSVYYPIVICALGGAVIGFCQKKIGEYPEELQEVMETVKTTHRYEYKRLHYIAICALLPLVFGGSLGPEAGLTGVIAGLCTWVGDHFKRAAIEVKELASIGLSATLGTFFAAPLFGFMAPIESEDDGIEIPRKAKMIVYFAAIFGGLGSCSLLSELFGSAMELGHFDTITAGGEELLWFIPLALAGTAVGYFYHIFGKLAEAAFKPVRNFLVLRSAVGGIFLGVCGVLVPFSMFSGEAEMSIVMDSWQSMTAAVLLMTGFVKLVVVNVCMKSGWRGGNIFPIIFSGLCIGFGIARLIGIDSVFCVAVVTAALCGAVMRKPLAVTFVLLLCFPVKSIAFLCAAAFIGGGLPLPRFLEG